MASGPPRRPRSSGRPTCRRTRARDLTEEEVNRLREVIDRQFKVEGDLRREVNLNIKRLTEIVYRGLRHRRNLPVRGQRLPLQRRDVKKTVGIRRKK